MAAVVVGGEAVVVGRSSVVEGPLVVVVARVVVAPAVVAALGAALVGAVRLWAATLSLSSSEEVNGEVRIDTAMMPVTICAHSGHPR